MKNKLAVGTLLSIFFIFTVFAAAMETYTVGGTGISLSIPSDYLVIATGTTIDDPELSSLVSALGEEEVQAMLDQNALNQILLDVTPPSLEFEITVTSDYLSAEYADYSFTALSDDELSQYVSDTFANSGYQIDNYEITQADSTPFLFVDLSANTDTASYLRIYQAIKGRKTVVCSFHSLYGIPFSDETYQVMGNLIASITFPKTPEPPAVPASNSISSSVSDKSVHNADAISRVGTITGTVISLILVIIVGVCFSKKRKSKRATSNNIPSQPEKDLKLYASTPPKFSPFELVPVKLMGVTGQVERDRIIADILRGNTNPYTHNSFTCEADWNDYLSMKEAKAETDSHDVPDQAIAGSGTAAEAQPAPVFLGQIPPEQ